MMNDNDVGDLPHAWAAIMRRTTELGFDMPSAPRTAGLLRVLAASKPGGRMLELGTGTGLATAALLAGMSQDAELVSVDVDEAVQVVARDYLADDPRVSFRHEDGMTFIRNAAPSSYDLVFADAMPGKYEGLDEALALVRPGGFYIGDDMLAQPNWPPGHQARVDDLVQRLRATPGLTVTCLEWGTGFVLAVKTPVRVSG